MEHDKCTKNLLSHAVCALKQVFHTLLIDVRCVTLQVKVSTALINMYSVETQQHSHHYV